MLGRKNKAPAGDGEARAKAKAKPSDATSRVRVLSRVAAASVAVAVAGVGFGTFAAISAQAKVDAATAGTAEAVVTTRDVAKGETLSPDMVTTALVPASLRSSGAVSSAEDVVGKAASTDIPSNSQVSESLLYGPGNASSLADALTPGTQAASIAVDAQSGLAGLLRVGDVVRVRVADASAVGGSWGAETICEAARVVALGESLGEGTAPSDYATVTIEVTPEEAPLVAAAAEQGAVTLTLAAAGDGED